jgi:hypothetical protein
MSLPEKLRSLSFPPRCGQLIKREMIEASEVVSLRGKILAVMEAELGLGTSTRKCERF